MGIVRPWFKSIHVALNDLNLERVWIIHPGEKRYPVHEKVEALPLRELTALREFFESDG